MLAAYYMTKNEPNSVHDPDLITELERYHDNHETKECRTYKQLGIHLDEFLTLEAHTTHIVSKPELGTRSFFRGSLSTPHSIFSPRSLMLMRSFFEFPFSLVAQTLVAQPVVR
jgi:hypothetical protein